MTGRSVAESPPKRSGAPRQEGPAENATASDSAQSAPAGAASASRRSDCECHGPLTNAEAYYAITRLQRGLPSIDEIRHPAKRRRGIELAVNGWTAHVVGQLTSRRFEVWAEWLWNAYALMPGPRTLRDDLGVVAMWRRVRERVLYGLDELGLEATVTRTDELRPVALEHHPADVAGLVHVHRNEDDEERFWAPDVPAAVLLGTKPLDRHARDMLAAHRLIPAGDNQVPDASLRAFAGQLDLRNNDRPVAVPWRDHVRAWATLEGEPVLSAEPYSHVDAGELVAALADHFTASRLPLRVDGPHPGLWSPTATLVLIRHDPRAAALAAVREAIR